ncbi:LMBR1-like membrane protein-domain-containing protein [Cladochytrium replicatum]|nr:LMBR1-like membrane protein-domain-containing protein [Cladochytrium replicatum]
MAYFLVTALLILLAAGVASLLDYYGNRKTFPWYAQITLMVAWLFPFSIIVILPLDLASTLYRNCVADGKEVCSKPWAYVDEGFLWVFWQLVYWTMFNLTWFIIPIMQSWIRSGEFTPLRKLLGAIKDYLIYYAMVGAVGVVFLIYVLASKVFRETSDLLAFAMAGANAWGLLLVTVMLGYGLVEVPRGLWFHASAHWSLRYLEFHAPRRKEAMVDAEAEMYEVAREIAVAAQKIRPGDPLRYIVDKLLKKCPLASEGRAYDNDEHPPDLTIEYFRDLHARIKRAVRIQDRSQAQYEFLLRKAFLFQDIIANESSTDHIFRSSLVTIRDDQYKQFKLKLYWYWYIWIKPTLLRTASVIFALASIALVWSESTFQYKDIANITLSIPALILGNAGYLILQIVSTSFVLYMCTCAYSSLFRVKIFDIYELVPQHHSDEGSLLFIAAYLCRLTFPLCYNFLNMVNDEEDSVFVKYQGKNVNLAPLLGEGYNRWLPMMIAIIAGVTLVNLHGKIMRLFKIKNYFYETIASNDADTEEGRTIIEQERSIEERKQNRGTYAYSSHGLNVSSDGSQGGGGARSQTAKDYLAKYRSGALGAGGGSSSNDRESLLNSRPSMSSDTSEEGGGSAGNVGSMFSRGAGAVSNLFKPSASAGGVASSRPVGGSRVSGGQGRFSRFDDEERGKQVSSSSARPSSPPRVGRKFGVGATAAAASSGSSQSANGAKGSGVLSPPQNPAGTFALGFSGGGRGSGGGSIASATPKTKPKPSPTNVFGDL